MNLQEERRIAAVPPPSRSPSIQSPPARSSNVCGPIHMPTKHLLSGLSRNDEGNQGDDVAHVPEYPRSMARSGHPCVAPPPCACSNRRPCRCSSSVSLPLISSAGGAAADLLTELEAPRALAVTLFEDGPAGFVVEAYYDAGPRSR